MSHLPATIVGWTFPVAVALLLTAAPAATSAAPAVKPPSTIVQYNANARSYTFGACAYDYTALGATIFKTTGGTDIYYAEIHSYDSCTGANGYRRPAGPHRQGQGHHPEDAGKGHDRWAGAPGRWVHRRRPGGLHRDRTAVVTVIVPPQADMILRTRPATVSPGTWTGATIYEADVRPLTPQPSHHEARSPSPREGSRPR